jgi:DNA-binding phage protein
MQAAIQQNSTHFTPSADASLSTAQAQVVAALAQGHTVTVAARQAGVHRTTIYNWLRDEPEFKTAMQLAQTEYVASLKDQMRDLATAALQTLHKLIEDADTPAFVRLRTALAILERPHFPQADWRLPARIESPQQQQVLDGLAEVEADYRAMRMSDAVEAKARRS